MSFREELKQTNLMIEHMKKIKLKLDSKKFPPSIEELKIISKNHYSDYIDILKDIEINRFIQYIESQLDYEGRKTTSLK